MPRLPWLILQPHILQPPQSSPCLLHALSSAGPLLDIRATSLHSYLRGMKWLFSGPKPYIVPLLPLPPTEAAYKQWSLSHWLLPIHFWLEHSRKGRGGPQDCETSRLPHFLDNRFIDGGEVSLTAPPFTPRKIPGTHFC
jgi:hypothetical protein